ncbi:MAG: valine--tRNA ligase [Proteobacteria bacterium]|nr:valine--tRNA ligase [Pseudomonadota bacterium]
MLDKTYTPKSFEADWYKHWQENGHFAASPDRGDAPYTIMMPPPNVTGSLHIGHALTFTLQDVLIRYYRKQGRDALWQPGMDHAGIATQMVVERLLAKQGIDRRDLGRDEFVRRVWQWKEESGGVITQQLKSLGASPDWGRERFTLDEGLSTAVRHVFVRLYEDGLIYRDKRLVNWDPQLQTAISDLEVEARDIDGHYWHIRYPVENSSESVVIATGRPETMFGDTAVAVHPDDPRYQALIGKHIVQPITGRKLPIIADEFADMEKGTGAVKVTPAHDFNDFEMGRRHDLPIINILDASACLTGEAVPAPYQNMDRFAARKKLVKQLDAEGVLVESEAIRHSVPHGDRSGVPIEPWLMDQWYVKAEVLAQPAMEAVRDGRIKFVPAHWDRTYFDWMENIQPWCISRQLWWGHRIPAWYGEDGTIFVAMTEADAQAQAAKHYKLKKGETARLTQESDVLDTWFSSALWPFSTLGWPENTADLKRYYPSDVLVTGFDIIFFWVARMIMMGMYFAGDVPFRTVYIHALVRDVHGQKMSKSKGNVMDPLALVDKYGADALRFTLVALAAPGRDVKLAEERIAGYRNFATKIWNACRFLQMNEATSTTTLPTTPNHPFNQWIIARLTATAQAVEEGITGYRFNDVAEALYHFIWDAYCDWYVEFIKPLLTSTDKAVADETRAVASAVMHTALSMLNPFMPYITEELAKHVFSDQAKANTAESLIHADYPRLAKPTPAIRHGETTTSFIIAIITAIRSLRAEMRVPPKAILEVLYTKSDQAKIAPFADNEAIKRLGRISGMREVANFPKGAAQAIVEGITLALPLADILDFAAEKARLAKELAAAEAEVKKREGKLANPTFLAKAPKEVIAENKSQLDSHRLTCDKLKSAIGRLTM